MGAGCSTSSSESERSVSSDSEEERFQSSSSISAAMVQHEGGGGRKKVESFVPLRLVRPSPKAGGDLSESERVEHDRVQPRTT